MSRGANLSIIGLYEYDQAIFDGFNVPDGIDRDNCINEILLRCGDLSLIYPSFNIMKLAIKNWSAIEMPIWTTLYNTENLDYNPIWNVDGTVTEVYNHSGKNSKDGKNTGNGSETIDRTTEKDASGSRILDADGSKDQTTSGTNSKTTSGTVTGSATHDSTETGSTKGYNDTSWLDNDKRVIDSDDTTSETRSGTESDTASGSLTETSTNDESETTSSEETVTDTETRSRADGGSWNEEGTDTAEDTRTTRRTGNIGVTTTQRMITEEREVAQFSTIKYIVDSFKKRFCIMIY